MKQETIGDRIRARRKELKLSQVKLAFLVGVSNVAVSQWERDETEPTGDNLLSLSSALECQPQFIIRGDSASNKNNNVRYMGPYRARGEYPLISWISAGMWCEAIEPYHRNAIDRWYETALDCSEGSFWLEVKGDSMTAPSGLSIPEGTVILVDPEVEPMNGKLVVAKLENENEATFKKYVVDAGNKYLKPLNPQYNLIPINGNCRIVGVVIDAKIANLP